VRASTVRATVCMDVCGCERLLASSAGPGGQNGRRACFTGCVGGRMFSTTTFVIT
jgi:hypothetical protein